MKLSLYTKHSIMVSIGFLSIVAFSATVGQVSRHYDTPRSERQISSLSGGWERAGSATGECAVCSSESIFLEKDKIAFDDNWSPINGSSIDDKGTILVYLDGGSVVHIQKTRNKDEILVGDQHAKVAFVRK